VSLHKAQMHSTSLNESQSLTKLTVIYSIAK